MTAQILAVYHALLHKFHYHFIANLVQLTKILLIDAKAVTAVNVELHVQHHANSVINVVN